jgi:hypothetical protein
LDVAELTTRKGRFARDGAPGIASARPLFQLCLSCLIMGAILPLYSAPEKLFFINGLFDVQNS